MNFGNRNNTEDDSNLTKAQILDNLIQDRVLGRGRIDDVSYFCADLYQTIEGEQVHSGVRVTVKGHRNIDRNKFTGDEVAHIIQLAKSLDLVAEFTVYSNEVYTYINLKSVTRSQDRKEYPFSKGMNKSLGLDDVYHDSRKDQPNYKPNPVGRPKNKKKDNDND